MSMTVTPITLRAARVYVAANHRHHKPPQGGLFAVAAAVNGEIVGVAIVGMPVARMLADGWTVEVTRLCTDGTRNACSFLYRVAWRVANAMGYRKLVTYTLADEGGASLRGAGFRCLGQAGGGSWSRTIRPRVDEHPLQTKLRWEIESHSGGNPGEKSEGLHSDHRGIPQARSSEGGNSGRNPDVSIHSREPVGSNSASVGRLSPEQIQAMDVDAAPSLALITATDERGTP